MGSEIPNVHSVGREGVSERRNARSCLALRPGIAVTSPLPALRTALLLSCCRQHPNPAYRRKRLFWLVVPES